MTRGLVARLAITVLTTVATTTATTIDFEAQGGSAPSSFNSSLNSPLVIGLATFTGGKLLKNEAEGSDLTTVYATVGGVFAGYTNPLTISFSQPVSDVSLSVVNEIPDTYTLTDNLGGNVSGATTICSVLCSSIPVSITDVDVTRITVATGATVNWDFAIDGISFTPVVASTPEPATFTTAALLLLGGFAFRKRNVRQQSGEATYLLKD